ncbi:MAG: (d)CMP kinase, partial [Betaproteobacteria bacterium AqS2]|nr:(d)CMP kinase [Betaproteobacteria bacterium AqS2]
ATGASLVSQMPPVREALLACQRDFRTGRGLVADGRDMASTIFPDAVLAVYLDAAMEVRAERFRQRAASQGLPDAKIAAGLSQFKERSMRDERRRVAPVRPAAGAVVIATDELDQGQVTEKIIELYRQRTQP